MMSSGSIEPHLVYWWSGKDALVNNQWIDRVSGLALNGYNGNAPQQSDGGYICEGSNFFSMDLNAASPNGLNIGRLWRIEVEFAPLSQPTGRSSFVLFDFGSIGTAIHAFGLMYDTALLKLNSNYKGLSNNDDATYGPTLTRSSALVIGETYRAAVGCESFDAENDIQYVQEGKGAKEYGASPHPQTTFNRNFNAGSAHIGCGFRDDSLSYSIKIYSIKIYNYD